MGSCVSVHKDQDSAMKFRMSFGSRNEKLLIPSPLKEKTEMVNGVDRTVADVALKSQWSPAPVTIFRDNGGSKDAIFFDSQPWLDSDCEDDFLSVNGDFTPSRGSTPVHHSFSIGDPQVNKAFVVEETTLFSEPEPPPSDKKKRLLELFKESLRVGEQYADGESTAGDENGVHAKVEAAANSHVPQAKSTIGTTGANSGCNSERTPNGGEDKSAKSAQCCLPRLLSSRSFSERKKKMSPVHSVG